MAEVPAPKLLPRPGPTRIRERETTRSHSVYSVPFLVEVALPQGLANGADRSRTESSAAARPQEAESEWSTGGRSPETPVESKKPESNKHHNAFHCPFDASS